MTYKKCKTHSFLDWETLSEEMSTSFENFRSIEYKVKKCTKCPHAVFKYIVHK